MSRTAIKKIPAERIAVGMYIHDLNCGWMDHPFLTNRFEVKDEETVRKIAEVGIREVFIDTERGLDVTEEVEAKAAAPAEAQHRPPEAPIVVSPPSLADEVKRARKLHSDASKLVSGMMQDIRLGKQIVIEQCEPLVEGILDSIFRLPSALLPLAQVKNRDEYTFQHSVSVAALAVAFGRVLDLPRDVIKELAMGGLLHDVGKALVPAGILNKPGKLTDQEFAVMKEHASHGAELLGRTKNVSKIAYHAAAEHHERYDGSGYPHGLKGDAISLYGQMTAIVDVYDAITSLRVYHTGLPPTEALRKIFEWSKSHFHPRLAQAFIKGIGIYPAGSLVRLESGRLGVVSQVAPEKLLQPVVKIIFDAAAQRYLAPQTIDLAAAQDKIVAHESFEKWGIDQAAWL